MKIFIGGSRGIKTLDQTVYCSLEAMYKSSIYKLGENKEGDEVLIGDADGVDRLVQEFYHKMKRQSVTVFACEGKPRHNVGAWRVENVAVTSTRKDFSYYSQKDIAMANAADCGFMIWNGKSKGTLCNIINLVLLNKKVTVYFTPVKEYIDVENIGELKVLIESCCENTQSMFKRQQKDYMRTLYIEVIEKYMESKSMIDYLVENVDTLEEWQIVDLVCGARADLKEKYKTLKELAALEDEDEAKVRYSASNVAKMEKEALDELELKAGEVFVNAVYGYDNVLKEERMFGARPHFSLKPVIEYIKKEYAKSDKKGDATYWYELDKYVPGVIDDMDLPYSYIIAPNGEMWFTDNINFHRHFSSSQYMNLPVPFKVGDIITIDCTPFAPIKHAVITQVGNNRDRSSVVCAFVTDNGKVSYCHLKNPMFFGGIVVMVSPLYRAELFTGELPDKEKPLKEIADKLCT